MIEWEPLGHIGLSRVGMFERMSLSGARGVELWGEGDMWLEVFLEPH